MILGVGVVRPDRLDPWPDRSGQAPGLSGRPDRPAGLRQPWVYAYRLIRGGGAAAELQR